MWKDSLLLPPSSCWSQHLPSALPGPPKLGLSNQILDNYPRSIDAPRVIHHCQILCMCRKAPYVQHSVFSAFPWHRQDKVWQLSFDIWGKGLLKVTCPADSSGKTRVQTSGFRKQSSLRRRSLQTRWHRTVRGESILSSDLASIQSSDKDPTPCLRTPRHMTENKREHCHYGGPTSWITLASSQILTRRLFISALRKSLYFLSSFFFFLSSSTISFGTAINETGRLISYFVYRCRNTFPQTLVRKSKDLISLQCSYFVCSRKSLMGGKGEVFKH